VTVLIAAVDVAAFVAFAAAVLLVAGLVAFGGEFHITVRPHRRPQVTRIGGRRLTCRCCGAPTVVPDDARDLTEGEQR
jgi:hypothetical protein